MDKLYNSYGEALIGGDADPMDLINRLNETGNDDIVYELVSELMKTVYSEPSNDSGKFRIIRKADKYLTGEGND